MAPDRSTPSPTPSGEPMKRLPPRKQQQVITRLWQRMAAIYGQGRWLAHAPMTIPASDGQPEQRGVESDWLDILGECSMSDIARGIARCEQAPGKFPPGASVFRVMCREFQPGTFAGNAQPGQVVGSVVELLQTAQVAGGARAYLDMCKQLTIGHQLKRAQLEMLPPVLLNDGTVLRPSECVIASDDLEEVSE